MDPNLHNITIVVIGTDRVVLVVVGLLGGDDALTTNPDFHSENHGILVRKVRMEGFHFSIREPQRQVLPTINVGRNSIASQQYTSLRDGHIILGRKYSVRTEKWKWCVLEIITSIHQIRRI
jgi:hypothetical protein